MKISEKEHAGGGGGEEEVAASKDLPPEFDVEFLTLEAELKWAEECRGARAFSRCFVVAPAVSASPCNHWRICAVSFYLPLAWACLTGETANHVNTTSYHSASAVLKRWL
jgi:hypothetical protein